MTMRSCSIPRPHRIVADLAAVETYFARTYINAPTIRGSGPILVMIDGGLATVVPNHRCSQKPLTSFRLRHRRRRPPILRR
jgi:hypothetical protein